MKKHSYSLRMVLLHAITQVNQSPQLIIHYLFIHIWSLHSKNSANANILYGS